MVKHSNSQTIVEQFNTSVEVITLPLSNHPTSSSSPSDIQTIGQKLVNSHGFLVCGVLNQHRKPCKRIGKCPFHSRASPEADDTMTLKRGKKKPTGTYKKGWTREEHLKFLQGLQIHGKGSWKEISQIVVTKNSTQIQSHAQKYYLRQKQLKKNKKSIHDITIEDLQGNNDKILVTHQTQTSSSSSVPSFQVVNLNGQNFQHSGQPIPIGISFPSYNPMVQSYTPITEPSMIHSSNDSIMNHPIVQIPSLLHPSKSIPISFVPYNNFSNFPSLGNAEICAKQTAITRSDESGQRLTSPILPSPRFRSSFQTFETIVQQIQQNQRTDQNKDEENA